MKRMGKNGLGLDESMAESLKARKALVEAPTILVFITRQTKAIAFWP